MVYVKDCRVRSLKLLSGAAAVALLMSGMGARAANDTVQTQEASLPAASASESQSSIPLGPVNVREVQNQLIALGFDPGPADGLAGPATLSAAQQYDLSRGGNGRVEVDGAFLARLKADTAPRLTYEQVAARSRRVQPAAPSTTSPQPPAASASSQFGNVVSQIAPIIGAAIANSNNHGYGPGYYGPGPSYYGPPPGYYGYGYGGF
ncbi:MAG: peptidoglycan-binding protein [Enhydrobacter sp.]|nr:peptidoglycan-binding protein [Enhydrobacter sp.]